MTREISKKVNDIDTSIKEDDDVSIVVNEEDEVSDTPILDLVRNSKPHEFGEVMANELSNRARECVADIKSQTED